MRKQLIEKAGAALSEMKRLRDLRNTEGRAWTAEDNAAWEKANKDYDAARAAVEDFDRRAADEQRIADADRFLTEPVGDRRIGREPVGAGTRTATVNPAQAIRAWMKDKAGIDLTEEEERACSEFRLNPRRSFIDLGGWDSRDVGDAQREYRTRDAQSATTRLIDRRLEQRATITTGVAASTIPTTIMDRVEVNMLAFGGVRQVAETIVTDGGNPLPWPTFNDTSNTAVILGEATNADASGTGGPNPTIGSLILTAYKFSSQALLVSQETLEDSAVDIERLVGDAIGERLGRGTNTFFTTGTGGGAQPSGIVTGAALGVTAASATAITALEVIRLQHSVDSAYRGLPGAGWMMHDNVILALRLLLDGNSQPIWQPGLQENRPDRLLGQPVTVNQAMASSVATTNKTILFGALNQYKIRRVRGIRLFVSDELYRASDRTGFYGFLREDGALLNAGTSPVKYLQQA